MIGFICPKPETPSGGVWFIHRIVKLLNDAGVPARVIQTEPFVVWWDANPIPDEYISTLRDAAPCTTIVVPEVAWPLMNFENSRKICFVQNRMWLPQELETYRGRLEVIVPSRYLANYMVREWGAKVLGKITPFLDEDVWRPTPKTKDRVLVVARRNPYHEAVAYALSEQGYLVDYVTTPQSQRDLAEHLCYAEYYVHLTHPEGFPMACLEAMRMGTLVVGTTGGGGNEFMFHDETAWVVQDPDNGHYGNPQEFVHRVVEGMAVLRADHEKRSRVWQSAYNWSLRYNAERTTHELLKVFA